MLVGDSHAAAAVGFMQEFAMAEGFPLFNLAQAACPPLFSNPWLLGNINKAWGPQWGKKCKEAMARFHTHVKDFDVIVLAAAWANYMVIPNWKYDGYVDQFFAQALRETVENLLRLNKTVILLGDNIFFPGFENCPMTIVGEASLAQEACVKKFPFPKVWNSNHVVRQLADRLNNVEYFDINDWLCPHGQCSCYAQLENEPDTRLLLLTDNSHLNWQGSKLIGSQIVKHKGVPWVLQRAVSQS
jgi:hypothetical protein